MLEKGKECKRVRTKGGGRIKKSKWQIGEEERKKWKERKKIWRIDGNKRWAER